jgi:hypothetical protein
LDNKEESNDDRLHPAISALLILGGTFLAVLLIMGVFLPALSGPPSEEHPAEVAAAHTAVALPTGPISSSTPTAHPSPVATGIDVTVTCSNGKQLRLEGIDMPATCVHARIRNRDRTEGRISFPTLSLYDSSGEEMQCDWYATLGHSMLRDRIIRPRQSITLEACCPGTGIGEVTERASTAEYAFAGEGSFEHQKFEVSCH